MSEQSEQPKSGCGCAGAGPAFTEFVKKMAPAEDVKKHFDEARLSFLKGLRALIDHRIENLSQSSPKGSKINVD